MSDETISISEEILLEEAVTPIEPLFVVDTFLVLDGDDIGSVAEFQTPIEEACSIADLVTVSKFGFTAKAVSSTRVLLLFGTVMPSAPVLVDPATYTVVSLAGVTATVTAVQAFTSAVVLTLGGALASSMHYNVIIAGALSMDGLSLTGKKSSFQWTASPRRVRIPLRDFSGEARGGLLGEPEGLVFFSPAFDQPAPTSAIQVDEVSVCTKSYDTYSIPQPIDPSPLYTYSGTAPSSTLNGAVLWAAFPRLVDARIEPSLLPSDALAAYVDSRCIAELSEPLDPDFVGLLNNNGWKLFDNTSPPPRAFITANNLAPIPPGGGSTITLQP